MLPKNIWLYVSQIPEPARSAASFVLQGGTQHNLAAVKAQVDFIESRFRDKGVKADVIVHEHCGESGAIGAAIEAEPPVEERHARPSSSVSKPLPRSATSTTATKTTRCYFCKNKCLRTFIDVNDGDPESDRQASGQDQDSTRRGAQAPDRCNSCEKGLVEDVNAMREIKKGMDAIKKENPTWPRSPPKLPSRAIEPPVVADPLPRFAITKPQKARVAAMKRRAELRIGIPRV